jgi:ribonuclease HI
MTLIAAADGSALGNPGPAGWAWYVDADHWACGGWPRGTNNMGELTAVLDLLRRTASSDEDLLVFCDSTYVINSITKWMPGWKRRGWRKGDGKPVQNVDIMKSLDEAMQGRQVRFEWVKGHAGHELNEAADRLANAAAAAYSRGQRPDPGPGFGSGRRAADVAVPPAEIDRSAPEDDLFSVRDTAELSDEERVIGLERALLTDQVRADRASVAALLHPDWCEIGRSGRLYGREEMLDLIGPMPSPVSLDTVTVSRVDEHTILLVWRASTDDRTTLRSSLWVRDQEGWRQRFHQGTDEGRGH